MPAHLALFVPGLPAVAKFVAGQLKDPAMKALALDPLSKALYRGLETFLVLFEHEYQVHEALPSLLAESTKESVSVFLKAEAVQQVLSGPFRNPNSFDVSALPAVWNELRASNGEKLISLPVGFDWDALGASYLEAVRAIVSETPQLREMWQANSVDDIRRATEAIRGVAPRFTVEKYRRALVEEFGTLKLSVMRADQDGGLGDRAVSLQKVYVRQRVKEAFPPQNLSRDYLRRLEAELHLHGLLENTALEDLAAQYERAPVIPIGDVLADSSCQRLVILGDPGLGKSTLLQHLALEWAEQTSTSTSMPFFVELRKYTRDHSRPKSFLEFLEKGTWSHCHLPQGELDRHLRDGHVVVFFDGLDEVFEETLRGNITAEIISFARDYPRARVIVTTRVIGFAIGSPNPEQFRSAGFRQFTLQYFDDPEIQEFVQRWYSTAIPDQSEGDELAERLIRTVSESNAIRELAGNPLLLTMMALLNRRKHLPRERVKVYEACAELLVEGWDAARHLDRSAYLVHDDKVEILQRIAYEMQHEREGLRGNMLSETRLKSILVAALQDRNIQNPRMAAQRIVIGLTERDFMLCFVGDEQFSFVHRTFLEYFCAKEYKSHLENASGKDELCALFGSRWSEDAWQEVLRLICAMVGPDLAATLVRELLSAKTNESGWKAILLTAECVNEIRQIGKVEAERDSARRELVSLLGMSADDLSDVETETVISIRVGAIERLARFWQDDITRDLLYTTAGDTYWKVRWASVEGLAKYWRTGSTRQWMMEQADTQKWGLRQAVFHGIAFGWPDERTRHFLLEQIDSQDEKVPFRTAIIELSQRWPTETSREWLVHTATHHKLAEARAAAIHEIGSRWQDDAARNWIIERVEHDEHLDGKLAAVTTLAEIWTDKATMELITQLSHHKQDNIADATVLGIALTHRTDSIRRLLLDRMSISKDGDLRARLVSALVWGWPSDSNRELLVDWATQDKQGKVRWIAVRELIRNWPDETTREIAMERAINDQGSSARRYVLSQLPRYWPDERTKLLLLDRFANDPAPTVRREARDSLIREWPDDPAVESLRNQSEG